MDKKLVFEQLRFAIVRSAGIDGKLAAEISDRLRLHGAEVIIDQYPEKNLNLDGVTHIISTTSDFPDYYGATDLFIPVVTPPWISDSIARQRLLPPRQYNPNPRYFMSDVTICCADIPEGDADAICGGILAMGGNFTNKLSTATTHIVALSLQNDACDIARDRDLDCKIVLPHWFDDCLRLGKRIDEKPYELPDPEILHVLDSSKAPLGKHTNKYVSDALDPHPDQKSIMSPKKKRVSSTVFKGKTFMLASDLGIGEYLRGILDGIISSGGGKITDEVMEADYFICKYRDGRDYKTASRAGIDVGNLAWLYYLILHDEWTSPYRRLLHYPVSRTGLQGFQNLKISLSNYSGEARTYLENLINATGAECTKTLRQENTHLVTAHDQSEKCAAAKDWGVHMINHLWLEESYAQWQIQSVTNKRYTHFPRRTNLGEVVGQTQLDRHVLSRFWTEDDTEMTEAPPAAPAAQQSNKAKTLTLTKVEPDALTTPVKQEARPRSQNGKMGSDHNEFETPVTRRQAATGKENITPMTTGSRKSKDLAAAKLQTMSEDIALYEKEKKRVGGVTHGGRRKSEPKESTASRKRSIDPAEDEDKAVETKKQRKGPAPIDMHLLISGYKRWVGKAKQEDADLKHLRELGIAVVSEPSKASHLAVPQIVRTAKFVVALAYAPTIISTNFIDACLEQDEFLNPDDFLLKDAKNEKRLIGHSLTKSCERAKKNKHQLLTGRIVYAVEKIHGGFNTYQAIVEANGGQCMTYRGRHGIVIPSKRAGSEGDGDSDPSNEVYLLSSDSKEDQRLWSKFSKMAEGSRKQPRIVRTDWLLDTAMKQEIQPTAPYELTSNV